MFSDIIVALGRLVLICVTSSLHCVASERVREPSEKLMSSLCQIWCRTLNTMSTRRWAPASHPMTSSAPLLCLSVSIFRVNNQTTADRNWVTIGELDSSDIESWARIFICVNTVVALWWDISPSPCGYKAYWADLDTLGPLHPWLVKSFTILTDDSASLETTQGDENCLVTLLAPSQEMGACDTRYLSPSNRIRT